MDITLFAWGIKMQVVPKSYLVQGWFWIPMFGVVVYQKQIIIKYKTKKQ